MEEEVHIGALIKKKMNEDGRKAKWLADKIGCVPHNIYWIYQQQHIGTEQLILICTHLEMDFFACYSEYVCQQAQLPEKLHHVNEKIHIGNLIQGKMNEDGRKNRWLARIIGCDRSHIYRIYQHQHIDIKQLILICIHLKMNFFDYYSTYVLKKIQEKRDSL